MPQGEKFPLTRLPMRHALVPSLFQRLATACLEKVRLATKVEGIAYLEDWLLFDRDPRALGITIDEDKSVLNPTHKLVRSTQSEWQYS